MQSFRCMTRLRQEQCMSCCCAGVAESPSPHMVLVTPSALMCMRETWRPRAQRPAPSCKAFVRPKVRASRHSDKLAQVLCPLSSTFRSRHRLKHVEALKHSNSGYQRTRA